VQSPKIVFSALTQAQQIVETWRGESNEGRPLKALGKKTPNEFANEIAAGRGLVALQSAGKSPWSRCGKAGPVTVMRSLSAKPVQKLGLVNPHGRQRGHSKFTASE
jgi:hypothetical protein